MKALSDFHVAAFYDELEKIAAAGGFSDAELGMLKEAILAPLRRALSSGVSNIAGGLERGGSTGGALTLKALNSPIMTGDAGRGLVTAGKHIASTAAPGALGGMQYGVGQALEHHGHTLAGGGAKALGSALWHTVNPVGTAAQIGLTGAGHATSRALNLSPTGLGHNVLTKAVPKAGELLGSAGTSLAVGAPVGMAGMLGHHAMGAMGHFAPAVADAAGHALGPLGEAGGEFAHHLGADLLGSHGQRTVSRMQRAMPAQV